MSIKIFVIPDMPRAKNNILDKYRGFVIRDECAYLKEKSAEVARLPGSINISATYAIIDLVLSFINNMKMKINKAINNIIRKGTKILLTPFCLIPVRRNRILFESFQGRSISDSPRYIFDYLCNHSNMQFECIWVLNDKNNNPINGVKTVKHRSIPWIYYQLTARVIISNMNPPSFVPKRNDQLFIETWHAGGAFKAINKNANRNSSKKSRIDAFLSSSYIFTKYNIMDARNYMGVVLNTGLPRNDLFFNSSLVAEITQKVKKYYRIKEKIILYAPTWRGDELSDAEAINDDELLDVPQLIDTINSESDDKYVVFFRKHYADRKTYTFRRDIIDVSMYPDMQELLCAADMVITDYSSIIWDYSLLKRPCFLYVPKYNDYINTQGVFTPISTWPGIICRTLKELTYEIINCDRDVFIGKASLYLEQAGSFEDGQACKRVTDYIIENV